MSESVVATLASAPIVSSTPRCVTACMSGAPRIAACVETSAGPTDANRPVIGTCLVHENLADAADERSGAAQCGFSKGEANRITSHPTERWRRVQALHLVDAHRSVG